MSKNGLYFVTAGADKSIKIWSMAEKRCINTFQNAHDGNILSYFLTIR